MTNWDDLKQYGAFEPSEMLIAISQKRVILQELTSLLGGEPELAETDAVLGLALVKLNGLESKFERDAAQHNASRNTKDQRAPIQPIDIVLRELRNRFKNTYEFLPTIGKNRTLAQVGDLHNIGVGSDGVPVPYHASAERGLPPRKSFPGMGVEVGVADTAILPNPWIDGAYRAAPYDRSGRRPALFTEGHAAFVCGLILQQAPGCTIVARRVLDDEGQATAWSVAQELVHFAGSGISVLNLSLGCFTDDNEAPLALATALDRIGPEIVVIAAAGNYDRPHAGPDDAVRPMWPAALEEVLAIGAVDRDGNACSWSPPLTTPWLDAVAVGDEVVSTYLTGEVRVPDSQAGPPSAPWTSAQLTSLHYTTELASWSGTSFAAATVSGAVAARTVPGVYSARAAWDALRSESSPAKGSEVPQIGCRPLVARANASAG